MRREKERGRQNESEEESCPREGGRNPPSKKAEHAVRSEKGVGGSLGHVIQGPHRTLGRKRSGALPCVGTSREPRTEGEPLSASDRTGDSGKSQIYRGDSQNTYQVIRWGPQPWCWAVLSPAGPDYTATNLLAAGL